MLIYGYFAATFAYLAVSVALSSCTRPVEEKQKEEWLNDANFQSVFKMTKAEVRTTRRACVFVAVIGSHQCGFLIHY